MFKTHFYLFNSCNLAQLAVLELLPRFGVYGVPTKRPEDYFAEMVKSDKHMQRIREKLIQKKAEIEQKTKARQLRQLRKESKYVSDFLTIRPIFSFNFILL